MDDGLLMIGSELTGHMVLLRRESPEDDGKWTGRSGVDDSDRQEAGDESAEEEELLLLLLVHDPVDERNDVIDDSRTWRHKCWVPTSSWVWPDGDDAAAAGRAASFLSVRLLALPDEAEWFTTAAGGTKIELGASPTLL